MNQSEQSNQLIRAAAAILLLSSSSAQAQTDNEISGTAAGAITSGSRNVLFGDYAATNLSNSSENVISGYYAGYFINNGSTSQAKQNVILGFRANGGYTQEEWDASLTNPDALPDLDRTFNSASGNIFIGSYAGLRNTSGTDNVFIGEEAGMLNTTTVDNTFLGARAGMNSTAIDNTFLGAEAGRETTTGRRNTFVGEQAGRDNQTGEYNTLVGAQAGLNNEADDLTAVGYRALYSNTTGYGSTAVGQEAGYSNTTGIKNTSVGWGAGTDITTGLFNTMLGAGAGNATNYADFNTFVGVSAGRDNNRTNSTTNANRNTYLGVAAGQTNRNGSNNVFIGAFADMGDWSTKDEAAIIAGLSNQDELQMGPGYPDNFDQSVEQSVMVGALGYLTGDDAVGIGYKAKTTGNQSITIGATAQTTHENAITIGYGASSHADDTVVLGNADTVGWHPNTDGVTELGSPSYRFSNIYSQAFTATGDPASPAEISLHADGGASNNDRWKLSAADGGDFTISSFATGADVAVITASNDGNVTIAGDVTLNSDARLKEEVRELENAGALIDQLTGKTYKWKPELGRDDRTHYGFIAQEVEAVVPELVSTNEDAGIKSVNYQGFTPILVNAVKELQAEGRAHDVELDELEQELAAQRVMLEAILREKGISQ